MTKNWHYFFAVMLLTATLMAACGPIENYDEANEPLFAGNYAVGQPNYTGEIKAITWNIKFGQDVDTVIAELNEVEALQGADIILLQEMDEQGVAEIAQALQYNYVYFPASIHPRYNQNFGNAILSPWPISNPTKLSLPFENPRSQQARIAVRALVMVGDKEVLAYSVHTETPWMSQRKRAAQVEFLATEIGDDYEHVVVGGDFNTFSQRNIADLEQRFERAGLERVSAGAGPTFESNGFKFRLDHIFAKGLPATENGVWSATEASDHFPLWVKLVLDDDPDKEAQSRD